MQKLDFNCEIVTPMFAGDAEPTDAAIRAQTIKGLMRFWWRAYNATKYKTIIELRQKEGEIFGTTEGNGRKSSFKIIVDAGNIRSTKESLIQEKDLMVKVEGKNFSINILEYLAFGPCQFGKIIRNYFSPENIFKMKIAIMDNKKEDDIIDSLKLLVYFGGIGSKSRNGYGKFRIGLTDNSDYKKLLQFNDIISKAKNLCKGSGSVAEFLSFNKESHLYELKNRYDSWYRCLGELGKIYRQSRLSLEKRHVYEKRQYIGAPIITKEKPKLILGEKERKGKPFFLNVIKVDNSYLGYILYLHSEKYHESKGNKTDYLKVLREVNEYLSKDMKAIF